MEVGQHRRGPLVRLMLAALAVVALTSAGISVHESFALEGRCADWACSSNAQCQNKACDICAGDSRCALIAGSEP
jgi:hypothetical protein